MLSPVTATSSPGPGLEGENPSESTQVAWAAWDRERGRQLRGLRREQENKRELRGDLVCLSVLLSLRQVREDALVHSLPFLEERLPWSPAHFQGQT